MCQICKMWNKCTITKEEAYELLHEFKENKVIDQDHVYYVIEKMENEHLELGFI